MCSYRRQRQLHLEIITTSSKIWQLDMLVFHKNMIIAKEIIAPFNNTDGQIRPIFARINIDRSTDIDSFLSKKQGGETAVLFCERKNIHDFLTNEDSIKNVIDDHINCAKNLLRNGVAHLAIAADNDGFFQKLLSPRFLTLTLNKRMEPLINLYDELSSITSNVGVILTVEENAPGGMDATDGVRIANTLYGHGLKEIIATSGTKDFMPLYDRRPTQKKRLSVEDFYSNEPSLAGALWLLENTKLGVWCLSFLDDQKKAFILLQSLGITGVIERALEY